LFTAITLLTLAVGIGANTAIFSVVNGIVLKPLPYPDAGRLVGLWETAPGVNLKEIDASPATYFTFREESRAFEDSAAWRSDSDSVTGIGQPEQVPAANVTDGALPLLGARPALGRLFTRQDDLPGSPKTVILSYGYWQRRFGGDPKVIGSRLMVDSEGRTIIGVLEQRFRFLDAKAALFTPLQFDRGKTFIGNFSYRAFAKLKPGITLAQANADMARMLPLMLNKFPPAPGMSLKMFIEARFAPDVRPLKRDVIGDIGKTLWLLMGTVGIVLFIACANVANLLLVRAEARQQELAIRAALGAGWRQIARELILESVFLGIAGGVLGLGLAYAALRLLVSMAPSTLPRLDEITIDGGVLLFTAAISLGAGLLFGLVPVFKYAGQRLGTALREGGRSLSESRERRRTRSALVVVQVALALVLLISSGLMIRTLQALRHVQPGFTSPDEILTLRVTLPYAQVPKPEQVLRMEHNMADKIAAIPGVAAVGMTTSITMDGYDMHDPIYASDRTYAEQQIPPLRTYKFISPDWFRSMGNPLIAGRDFNWTDNHDMRNVVIVSENLAREMWGSPAAALQKRVRENPKAPWREVIGVVGNEYDSGVDQKPPAIVYWPLAVKDFWDQGVNVRRDVAFAVRSPRAGTAAFLDQVRQSIWSVNPEIPVADVRTVREIYDKSMARTSFTLVMLAIAAAVALLLGIVGIYGVISYSVSQRTREIGIRIALGAPQNTVRRMFVRDGLMLTAIGLACGIVAAIALTRLMTAQLFGVSPLDPTTYAVVSAALAAAAFVAAYVPAWRATAVDPTEALRSE
jgi:predicted permease